MTDFNANHIAVTTRLKATASAWIGETASWTIRVEAGKHALNAGGVVLSTFVSHAAATARTATLNARTYNVAQTWTGGDVTGFPGGSVTDADCDKMAALAEAFWQAMKVYSPNFYTLESIRLYAVQANGKSENGVISYTPAAASAGSSSTNLTPDMAACISLYSAQLNKHGRGRIYFGPLAVSVLTTEGLFSTSLTGAASTNMVAWLNGIRAYTGTGGSLTYGPIIWSRTDKTRGSVISSVRVGDEPDGHETRTKQRPEIYTSATLTA